MPLLLYGRTPFQVSHNSYFIFRFHLYTCLTLTTYRSLFFLSFIIYLVLLSIFKCFFLFLPSNIQSHFLPVLFLYIFWLYNIIFKSLRVLLFRFHLPSFFNVSVDTLHILLFIIFWSAINVIFESLRILIFTFHLLLLFHGSEDFRCPPLQLFLPVFLSPLHNLVCSFLYFFFFLLSIFLTVLLPLNPLFNVP